MVALAAAAQCRIGTSGFHYNHWKGIFYPEGLPTKRWFEHYAAHFDTLEINNSFYKVPTVGAFELWKEQAPRGFLYALKYSRFGTHNKKLLDPAGTQRYFFERANHLGRQLTGPILLQLPPRWKVNVERLDAFLKAAARRRLRWAVEMREPSWLCEEVYAVLRRHKAALCIHDIIPNHPRVLTADWTYWRFHGWGTRYGGDYAEGELRRVAGEFRAYLRDGIDVFAYFNNDAQGHAVSNALQLKDLLGVPPPEWAGGGRAGRRAVARGRPQQRAKTKGRKVPAKGRRGGRSLSSRR